MLGTQSDMAKTNRGQTGEAPAVTATVVVATVVAATVAVAAGNGYVTGHSAMVRI